MEFNILQHFKGLENIPKDPYNADSIGASLFMTGNMGPRITEKMDGYAAKAGMSRRNFLRSSLAFPAAMLAANEVTGMRPKPRMSTPRTKRSRLRAPAPTSSSTCTRTSARAPLTTSRA